MKRLKMAVSLLLQLSVVANKTFCRTAVSHGQSAATETILQMCSVKPQYTARS